MIDDGDDSDFKKYFLRDEIFKRITEINLKGVLLSYEGREGDLVGNECNIFGFYLII